MLSPDQVENSDPHKEPPSKYEYMMVLFILLGLGEQGGFPFWPKSSPGSFIYKIISRQFVLLFKITNLFLIPGMGQEYHQKSMHGWEWTTSREGEASMQYLDVSSKLRTKNGFYVWIFQESPTEDIVSYVLQSLPKTSYNAFLEMFRMRQK